MAQKARVNNEPMLRLWPTVPVLARIRAMNRLECVIETMRYALNSLSSLLPDWLSDLAQPDWVSRYGPRAEDFRLPKTTDERIKYAKQVGQDEHTLLESLDTFVDPTLLWQLPAVNTLRRVWLQQFQLAGDQLLWRTEKEGKRRSVTLRIQVQHQALVNARHREDSVTYQTIYHRRAGIEGTISQGVRAFGLRRSRYIGLAKTHLQHVLTATALNLCRLDDWLNEQPRMATRQSTFVRLMAGKAAVS